MQNYLVYRAASADEINECSYSLLKHLTVYNLKPPREQNIVIYTDQPALLEAYGSYFENFELRPVIPECITRLQLIRHFMEQQGGNILYLDTNTYAVAPLETLFEDISKGSVYVLKWTNVIKQKKLTGKDLKKIIVGGKPFPFFPEELKKWNDSIIGLNSSSRTMLTQVVREAKESVADLPSEITEKWVFHYRFGQPSLKTAGHAIAQYDDLKEFRHLLRKFFVKYQEESVPNQLKLIHHFDAAMIQQQKIDWQKLPLYQQLYRRIKGKHWSFRAYEKKI
jgi:hypothetical protein